VSNIPYDAQAIDRKPESRPAAIVPTPARPAFQSWFPVWFSALSWVPFQLFGFEGCSLLPILGSIATAGSAGLLAEHFRAGRGLAGGFAGRAGYAPSLLLARSSGNTAWRAALVMAALYVAVTQTAGQRLRSLLLVTFAVALRGRWWSHSWCSRAWFYMASASS